MAKQTILTEIGTGEVMYPQTLASLVKTAGGGNVDEGLEQAKRAVFNDMWDAAWGNYGKYDPINAPDPQHPYKGNEIWMTYEEAVEVMAVSERGVLSRDYAAFRFLTASDRLAPRTLLPILLYGAPIEWLLGGQRNLEVVTIRFYSSPNVAAIVSDYRYCFYGCVKLKRINGILDVTSSSAPPSDPFTTVDIPLEEFKVKTNKSLDFKHFPKLSYESLRFLVDNATNTGSITITLHSDVYAKLTGDTTNEAAAWQQVLADAEEKNITFATT